MCSSINNAFNQIEILIPTSMYDNETIQTNNDNRSGENVVLINIGVARGGGARGPGAPPIKIPRTTKSYDNTA